MNPARHMLASVRALGVERIRLLGVLTGGHFVIHWFQQFFPIILPSIKSGLGLSNVEVGALTSAQQMIMGLGQLPVGLLADSMVRHRAKMLGFSLVAMGAAWVGIDRSGHSALASDRRCNIVQSFSGTSRDRAFHSRHRSNDQRYDHTAVCRRPAGEFLVGDRSAPAIVTRPVVCRAGLARSCRGFRRRRFTSTSNINSNPRGNGCH